MRGWWGVFFKRSSLQIFAKRRNVVSLRSKWFLVNNTGNHRFSFFIGSTAAGSSRVRRLLVARVKRQDGAERPVIRAWARLGKKHFFCKKGHNQRMGKGVGSSLTSRRIFRPGELFFLFSSDTLKSAHAFKSYLSARLVGNLVISTWSRYFGAAFLGKGPRGFASIRDVTPNMTGVQTRNTRRMFFIKLASYLRGRIRQRMRVKVGGRRRNQVAGLGGRVFSVGLVMPGGVFGRTSRARRLGGKRSLKRILPNLGYQSRQVYGRSRPRCRFITLSSGTQGLPTRIAFPFRSAPSRFRFKHTLGLFRHLAEIRRLQDAADPALVGNSSSLLRPELVNLIR
jgi:hypothetical protein